MIGIRADGNNQIGIGHIMRCLTIAEQLIQCGEEVIFIIADNGCKDIIRERGFHYEVLDTSFDDMNAESEKLKAVIFQHKIKKILIDSYYVTYEYLQQLREDVVTIYIDDIDRFPYPVDLLINYNVFATALEYPYGIVYNECIQNSDIKKGDITEVLAGPLYAPVRKEFAFERLPLTDTVGDILITLGGSDVYNLSFKIAQKLIKKTNTRLHIVCGPFNIHKTKLHELEKAYQQICIHENVKEMWTLMKKCEIAVSAAGSTMCELAVAGVPTVTFSFVENQRRIAETFGRNNAAILAGHYIPEEEGEFLDKIYEGVNRLICEKQLREAILREADKLVDGHGARRIAQVIMAYQK